MKVVSSLKIRCKNCKLVRRAGKKGKRILRRICANTRHKARQG